ncbi:hypothetical protein, partial [Serratia plymuthica]|uniref:hypothetical protein n=1 Tax=Serratia plymuthica TaxID=82996 RepID=UPI001AD7E75A
GSSQAATGIFDKNDRLLHSTAKPVLIPCCTQLYPQNPFARKIYEHRANVFATIPRDETLPLL